MQFLKATTEDMPQVKALWTQMFDDGTPGFPDFVFSSCKPENFYIAKDGKTVVSMLISMADMEYKGSFECSNDRYELGVIRSQQVK